MIGTIYFKDGGFETLYMRLTCLDSLASNTYKNHLMHTIRRYLP